MYRAHGVTRPRQLDNPNRSSRFALQIPAAPNKERGLKARTRLNVHRFLLLGWGSMEIADREGITERSVYNIQKNLREYGSTRKPPSSTTRLGRPPKLTEEDKDALSEELFRSGWMYQDEIVYWLWMERGVVVHRSTVSRLLKEREWSERTLRPFSIHQNEELRDMYRRAMRQFRAEDLVFLDESIFSEKTGWRHHAYAPIGHPARYTQDIRRGKTWAILPAYTIHGYLPCTGIKEGYYSHEDFKDWIEHALLPTLNRMYGSKPMVVVLDNVSIHTNPEIVALIEAAGHLVRFLPPYSPDFNPIELTFGVLKAWIRRNYCYIRASYSSFGDFLRASIARSRCDRFAIKHFKYAADGLYRMESDALIEARDEMTRWE